MEGGNPEYTFNEEEELAWPQFFEIHKNKFPLLVYVVGGYYGTSVYDDFCNDQIYRVNSYINQRRVVAKVTKVHDRFIDIYLSIPVSSDITFCVMKGHKSVEKPQRLEQLVKGRTFPIQVTFPADVSEIQIGSIREYTSTFATVLLTREYTEHFLLGNCVMNGEPSRGITVVALCDKISVATVIGIKGKSAEYFRKHLEKMATVLQGVNYDGTLGNPCISTITREGTGTGNPLPNVDPPLLPAETPPPSASDDDSDSEDNSHYETVSIPVTVPRVPPLDRDLPPISVNQNEPRRIVSVRQYVPQANIQPYTNSAIVSPQSQRRNGSVKETVNMYVGEVDNWTQIRETANLGSKESTQNSSAAIVKPKTSRAGTEPPAIPRRHSEDKPDLGAQSKDGTKAHLANLSVEDIGNTLTALNLDKYVDSFAEDMVDGEPSRGITVVAQCDQISVATVIGIKGKFAEYFRRHLEKMAKVLQGIKYGRTLGNPCISTITREGTGTGNPLPNVDPPLFPAKTPPPSSSDDDSDSEDNSHYEILSIPVTVPRVPPCDRGLPPRPVNPNEPRRILSVRPYASQANIQPYTNTAIVSPQSLKLNGSVKETVHMYVGEVDNWTQSRETANLGSKESTQNSSAAIVKPKTSRAGTEPPAIPGKPSKVKPDIGAESKESTEIRETAYLKPTEIIHNSSAAIGKPETSLKPTEITQNSSAAIVKPKISRAGTEPPAIPRKSSKVKPDIGAERKESTEIRETAYLKPTEIIHNSSAAIGKPETSLKPTEITQNSSAAIVKPKTSRAGTQPPAILRKPSKVKPDIGAESKESTEIRETEYLKPKEITHNSSAAIGKPETSLKPTEITQNISAAIGKPETSLKPTEITQNSSAEIVKPKTSRAGKELPVIPRRHSEDKPDMVAQSKEGTKAHLANLSVEDIGNTLRALNLDKYVDSFAEDMVDGIILAELTKADMKEGFGFKTVEQIRLWKFISDGHIPN